MWAEDRCTFSLKQETKTIHTHESTCAHPFPHPLTLLAHFTRAHSLHHACVRLVGDQGLEVVLDAREQTVSSLLADELGDVDDPRDGWDDAEGPGEGVAFAEAVALVLEDAVLARPLVVRVHPVLPEVHHRRA